MHAIYLSCEANSYSDPFCQSLEESLRILDKLVEEGSAAMTPLLRQHNRPSADWFMWVPEFFNDALGISRAVRTGTTHPVWTQGYGFSFAAGDVFYNCPSGYEPFGTANTPAPTLCIQVKAARPVITTRGSTTLEKGSVCFNVFSNENSKWVQRETRTTTQGDFIKILMLGL
jgi:hypothetical protein